MPALCVYFRTMRQLRLAPLVVAIVLGTASAVSAQDTPAVGQCSTPDSIAFRGASPDKNDMLRSGVGIAPKTAINGRLLSKAVKDLYATNLFDDVLPVCEIVDGKSLLIFNLKERPILSDVRVEGPD